MNLILLLCLHLNQFLSLVVHHAANMRFLVCFGVSWIQRFWTHNCYSYKLLWFYLITDFFLFLLFHSVYISRYDMNHEIFCNFSQYFFFLFFLIYTIPSSSSSKARNISFLLDIIRVKRKMIFFCDISCLQRPVEYADEESN